MESDNGDKLIQVSNKRLIRRKKERAKIDPALLVTPDTDTSSPSTSTSSIRIGNSTSSTKSDSIALNLNLTSEVISKIGRTQTTANENI